MRNLLRFRGKILKVAGCASAAALFVLAVVVAPRDARPRVLNHPVGAGTAPPHRAPPNRFPTALAFEPNLGQTNGQAKFLAHGGEYGLFLSGGEVVLSLRSQGSGARSRFERRLWSVARGPLQERSDGQLGIGLISTKLPLPFTTQKPELCAPAASSSSFVRLRLMGANANPKVIGLGKLKGKSNYFIGNDPKKWRTNVPNYARVMVKDVYPGIDQVFYGRESGVGGRESGVGSRESGELEYDFIVHPGADPKAIRLAAETQNWKLENGSWKIENRQSKIENASDGDLALQTDAGEVRLGKPLVYQAATDALNRQSTIDNRQFLQGQYTLTAENQITFTVPKYDGTQTLVIDPTLNFAATFGGTNGNSEGMGIAVDASGSAYVAGFSFATDFSTTPGAFEPTSPGPGGAVVWKTDNSGAAVYSTYLAGSSGQDQAFAIAIDSSGDAYVTGRTASTDFPVLNAFQPTLAGAIDTFVTELNPTGSALVYSSFLGGSLNTSGGSQTGYGVAIDAAGNAYVTGQTASSDFPIVNAFQPVLNGGSGARCDAGTLPGPCTDAFLTKVAPGGSALVYSTFLGGSDDDYGDAIAVDVAGDAYIVGYTLSLDLPTSSAFQPTCPTTTNASGATVCASGFVTELNASGSALVFSTYLGGPGQFDASGGFAVGQGNATGVALDPAGNIYVTGATNSTNFPTANAFQPLNASVLGGYNGFVTEFAPGGSSLVYSTYLGGSSGGDEPNGIAVDSLGEAFVTGAATSTDFPLANALQANFTGGGEAFVTAIQAGGKGLIYSTYLGINANSTTADDGFAIAADAAGNAWLTGNAGPGTTFVASISRPEAVGRIVPPGAAPNRNRLGVVGGGSALPRAAGGRPYLLRPEQSSGSGVTAALAGSIALDMARVHAAPASLDFAAEVAGTTSAPETVTISNPGTAPLTFSAITASDSFAVPSGGSCSTSSPVAAGGSCTVDVAFAPTGGGSLTGTLTLTDNGIGSPHGVPLSGTGQDFTLSTNQSSASVTAGGTATFNLSVGSQGGFSHSLDLSCTDPASLSTCTVSPASVTPTSASPATVTVSVTTTASSQVAPRGPNGPGPIAGQRPALQLWLMALAMLALFAVAAMSSSPRVAALLRRGRPRPLPSQRAGSSGDPWIPAPRSGPGTSFAGMTSKGVAGACLALALLLVLAWAACGGGGQPGTPAGTYTVTLKALDTQANLSHSTTVTLTVH